MAENVRIPAVGDRFSCWEDFHKMMKAYCDSTHEPLVISNSKTCVVKNGQIKGLPYPLKFVYAHVAQILGRGVIRSGDTHLFWHGSTWLTIILAHENKNIKTNL
ncbi:hypothetical protein CAPTEDRAFT_192663 [Capitella teleta]|uniref:Uncharacterized protein n=1 Tax=Capitella teleta TaxID=283909 RepID=R7VGA4_CAPTE|nr:hypothetical protein CAPTEDRAFT_192663 [Capitella teleta]|eukprot:ELU15336.1 hypothetical protein CAPTEDRAFT_192663 [Capitella teleta]